MATIRPEVQEACDQLQANAEDFTVLLLNFARIDQNRLNQRETETLIEALRANANLRQMRFVLCHVSGPENTAFLNFVADTLIPSHPSLKRLLLMGNRVTDEAAERIAGALKRNECLLSFTLSHNRIPTNGVQSLAEGIRHNNTLTGFSLSYNGADLYLCQTIISSISAKPNFKLFEHLVLEGNSIGVEGSKVISNFIPKAKSLKYLDLDLNYIGDEGCQHIANALPKTTSLKEILLCRNNISDIGCMSITNALQKNCSVWRVDLKGNNIADIGAAALMATLQHANVVIHSLDLNDNEGVSNEKRESISSLCNFNLQINEAFDYLESNLPKIPLGLWPMALGAVEAKPGLLFRLIKAKPEVFRERRAQRKRKHPKRLQY